MSKLRTALATAAAATLGLAALATAPAQAAAQPAFLAASQMPPSSTPWTATQIFAGVPENGGVLCASYKIPAQNSATASSAPSSTPTASRSPPSPAPRPTP